MHSLARVSWFLGVATVVSWLLVLAVSLFGLAALDSEVNPLVLVLAVILTAAVVEFPTRWIERHRGRHALRIPASDALLLELPGFAGLLAAGITLLWWQDLGAAMLVSAFTSVWALAAPLSVWWRHRGGAAAG